MVTNLTDLLGRSLWFVQIPRNHASEASCFTFMYAFTTYFLHQPNHIQIRLRLLLYDFTVPTLHFLILHHFWSSILSRWPSNRWNGTLLRPFRADLLPSYLHQESMNLLISYLTLGAFEKCTFARHQRRASGFFSSWWSWEEAAACFDAEAHERKVRWRLARVGFMKRRWVHPPLALRCFSWRMGVGTLLQIIVVK